MTEEILFLAADRPSELATIIVAGTADVPYDPILEVCMQDKLRFEGLSLTVDSVAKSVEFYSGTLGLEVAYNHEPAFALIRVGGDFGGTIGLLSVEEAGKEGAAKMTSTQKRAIHIEFTTDDLDTVYAELTARGMTFHEPPHDEPWERVMTAFDPDGYSVEIAQGRRGQDGEIWTEGSERSRDRIAGQAPPAEK